MQNIENDEKNNETNTNQISQSNLRPSLDNNKTGVSLRNSIRNSIQKISEFYEINNRVLTLNLADEDQEINSGNKDEPLFDDLIISPKQISPNISASSIHGKNNKGELSFFATLFTFIKVYIVGSFLFLPGGFKQGGWLFSVITIFIITIITIYSNISLSECTDAAQSFNFSKIGYKAAGKFGYYIVEIGIASIQICFAMTFVNLIVTIVNTMIKNWLHDSGSPDNYYIYIGLGLFCIVMPLCLIKNVSKFAKWHMIGDIAVVTTMVTLAFESISTITTDLNFNYDNFKLFNSGWYILMGMSIASLEGIGVILPIKENMKDPTKFNYVIILGLTFVSIFITGFPLTMYLCYQDNVKEIVLSNLPVEKYYIQFVLGLMVFSVIIIYPAFLYPPFIILEKIFIIGSNKRRSRINNESLENNSNWLKENITRIILTALCIAVGVFSINRFETLMALAGSAIATPVALILPTTLHFLLFRSTQSTVRSFLDLFVAFLGITMSLIVVIFTFFFG